MHTTPTPRARLPIHNSTASARVTRFPLRATLARAATVAHGVASLGALLALASCAPLEGGLAPPPIEYLSVAVVIGDRGALHRHAGVHYEIANATARTIVGFEVAFDLFDGSSRPVPELGRNSFRVSEDGRIEPGESRRYSISFDAIPGHPYDVLVLSRFRVSRVEFDDGSQWHNSGAHLYEGDDA